MRFAFLCFGAVGFALVAITGYSADRPIDLVLRDAAVACLVTALVGRWFWRVLDSAFAETVAARRAAAAAAAEAEEAAAKASPAPSALSAKSMPARSATASANAAASR